MRTVALTNTLHKKKESLDNKNLSNNHVKIYICGITPYDYAHLGHGRSSVNFDILVRLLTFLGYKVTHVRNFTDIDDKILNKAQQEGIPNDYATIAQKYINAYNQDMANLNCAKPTHEPKVTEYIPQIIEFIAQLVEQKKAYTIDHDVYFDISQFPSYGKLSGRKQEDLLAGARVDVDERKKNPGDFALWKGNDSGLFWQSPWGFGRPGWHIECSVMSNVLLGKTIDIHGGGMDLIFPHHENEIAQSEALHNAPLANIWIHNAFITINKEKMSKSLGNFITLQDLFKLYDPMVLRFFFLQHHYRTPIDFSDQELEASQTAYKKLIHAFTQVIPVVNAQNNNHPIIINMLDALCDDLNTPQFLGLVFEHLVTIKQDISLAATIKNLFTQVLGLTLAPIQEKSVTITPEIEDLINHREQARKEKNWAIADKIRDQLSALGYTVQDKKT